MNTNKKPSPTVGILIFVGCLVILLWTLSLASCAAVQETLGTIREGVNEAKSIMQLVRELLAFMKAWFEQVSKLIEQLKEASGWTTTEMAMAGMLGAGVAGGGALVAKKKT